MMEVGATPSEAELQAAGIRPLETAEALRAEVLEAVGPVVVAFTATWCAPCRWLYPFLIGHARAGAGFVRVRTVDVDRLPSAAARWAIGSVPTVLLLLQGEERARSVGLEPERLEAMFEAARREGKESRPEEAGPEAPDRDPTRS